jgi:hypothetical protein
MEDLATVLPASKATLIVTGVTTLAFALSAFSCDRLGHTIFSPFLQPGPTYRSTLSPVKHKEDAQSCIVGLDRLAVDQCR